MIHTTKLFLAALAILSWTPVSSQTRVEPARPTLGVALHTEGIAVESVDPGSLAARAGLAAGDFITHWGERSTADLEAIIAARDAAKAGEKVALRVMRETGSRALTLEIPDTIPASGLMLGINVGPGLWVARVDSGSAAERGGMKVGDILLSLGGREIVDVASLKDALARVSWNSTRPLRVRRGQETKILRIEFLDREHRQLGRRGEEATALEFPGSRPPIRSGKLPSLADSLLGLDEVKSELDASIAELKSMAKPELAAVIQRLEKQSEELSGIAGSIKGLKHWGMGLMQEFEQNVPGAPFMKSLDLRNIQKQMEDLMERHGDDIDAIRRALGEAYPGLEIFIEGSPHQFEMKFEAEADEASPEDPIEVEEIEVIEEEPTPAPKSDAEPEPKRKYNW